MTIREEQSSREGLAKDVALASQVLLRQIALTGRSNDAAYAFLRSPSVRKSNLLDEVYGTIHGTKVSGAAIRPEHPRGLSLGQKLIEATCLPGVQITETDQLYPVVIRDDHTLAVGGNEFFFMPKVNSRGRIRESFSWDLFHLNALLLNRDQSFMPLAEARRRCGVEELGSEPLKHETAKFIGRIAALPFIQSTDGRGTIYVDPLAVFVDTRVSDAGEAWMG